jgi:hypothetical protein
VHVNVHVNVNEYTTRISIKREYICHAGVDHA